MPIETAPVNVFVWVRFDDGEVCKARRFVDCHSNGHNGWVDEDGLDWDYGTTSPEVWKPI